MSPVEGINTVLPLLPAGDASARSDPAVSGSQKTTPVFSIPGYSRHIPVKSQQTGIGKTTLHEKALGLRAYRQQLLASNIANADTPNYKAVDVDVEAVLREVKAGRESLTLTATDPNHLPAHTPSEQPRSQIKYRVPSQPSLDGNTVDMQVEQAKFTENALKYQFSIDRAGGRFKQMRDLLNDLK